MPYVTAPDGKIYDIPEQQMYDALQSGQWIDVPAGSTMYMGDPRSGTPVKIDVTDPSNVLNALREGYKVESSEIGRQRWVSEEYGGTGQQALAAFEGFLSGATLGLSDVVETKLLGVDPQEIKARAESGSARAIAEFGGIAASTIATGGAGAGRGITAKILGSMPAGQVAKAGSKLRNLLAKGMPLTKAGRPIAKTAAEKLRLVGAQAAMGTFEGSLYSGGGALAQAMMDNLPLLSEETMAYIGPSMLLGGAAGAGIMGGGTLLAQGIRGAGSQMRKAVSKGGKPRPVIEDPYAVGGPAPTKAPASRVNKIHQMVRGESTLEEKAFVTSNPYAPHTRAAVENPHPLHAESVRAVMPALGSLEKETDSIVELVTRRLKPESMRPHIPTAPQAGLAAARESRIMWSGMFDEIDLLMKTTTNKGAIRELKLLKETLSKYHKEFLGTAGMTYDDMIKNIMSGRVTLEDMAHRLFVIGDKAKADIGALGNKFTKAAHRAGIEDMADVEALLWKNLYKKPQNFLEDVRIFGEAGSIQADMNGALHAWLAAARSQKKIRLYSRKATVEGRDIYEPDLEGVRRHLWKVGTEDYSQQWLRHMDDLENKFYSAEVIATRLGEKGPQLRRARTALEQIQAHMGRDPGTSRMWKVNMAGEINKAVQRGGLVTESLSYGIIGYAIGHIIAGYPGGLVGGILGTLTVPRNWVGALRQRDQLARALEKKIGLFKGLRHASAAMNRQSTSGARSVLGAAVKYPFGKGKVPLAVKAFDDFRFEDRKKRDEDPQKGYRRLAGELERMNSPQAIQERLEANMPGLAQEFPEIIGNMNLVAQRAVNYLMQVAPPDLYKDGLELVRGNKAPVASHALNLYWKKLRIIENPQLVWELIREGRLSLAEMEAIKAVYPEWLLKQRGRLMEELAKHKGNIPAVSKSMLAIFLESSTGPSSTRWYLEQHQQRYAMQQQELMQPPKQDSEFSGKRRMADELKSKMQGLQEKR